MLVFALVFTMGAFFQLDGIIAKAAEDVKSPVIEQNQDGTYDIILNYKDETGTVDSVEVMGTLPGASWDIGKSVNMEKGTDNVWSATIKSVEQGQSYEYKFLLNGKDWVQDPLNTSEKDGNSLITIEGSFTHKSPEVNGKEVTFCYWSQSAKKVQLPG